MSDEGSTGGIIAASCALGLSAAATVLLVIADVLWFGTGDTGGPPLTALYLGGWVLLLWAGIALVAAVVALIRGRGVRRRGIAVALTAGAAVLVVVVLVRPLI